MLPDLLFLLFAAGLLAGALGVVAARNPMYCVLGMIAAFVNASGLFLLFQAEFLGLLIVMVYVGAIAVMFLFVLMTIDIDFAMLKEGFAPYLPAGLLVAGGLLAQFLFAAWSGLFSGAFNGVGTPVSGGPQPENVVALGQVLFTTYALPFQAAGLVLLTAMIGAIVLTHRRRPGVKRQDVAAQIMRLRSDSLAITKPKVGEGATFRHWSPKSVEKSTPTDEEE